MKTRKYVNTWLSTLFSGKPHFIIGNPADPYLLRWYLIPRNHFINLYLHKFMKSDDDRAMHDHPWWFISMMISGRYFESLTVPNGRSSENWRHAPSIAFRWATDRHIVSLAKDEAGDPIPCWTIVLTGPNSRTWGFWCPKGFVPWDEFVDQTNSGNIGKGCG
jgi:hypothetical protein